MHAAQAVDHPEAFFQPARDLFLDLGGGRAFEVGADGERRVGEFGKEVQPQTFEGQAAEQGHGESRHGDGDWPGDRGRDDTHGGNGATGGDRLAIGVTRNPMDRLRRRRPPACRCAILLGR